MEFLRADFESCLEDQDMDMDQTAPLEHNTQVGGVEGSVPVLVELLQRVPPLTSNEPEELLRLFGKLDEICDLGLVNDKVFIS
jgi:hypothetical protein